MTEKELIKMSDDYVKIIRSILNEMELKNLDYHIHLLISSKENHNICTLHDAVNFERSEILHRLGIAINRVIE